MEFISGELPLSMDALVRIEATSFGMLVEARAKVLKACP